MEKIERRCFWIFMVWQEEKETAWLRWMANQGWHLQRIMVFVYVFAKKSPQDIVFFRDFTVLGAKDIDEYIGVFQDTGWRFVCRQSNWFENKVPTKCQQSARHFVNSILGIYKAHFGRKPSIQAEFEGFFSFTK